MIYFCPKRDNRVVIFVIHFEFIFEMYSTDQNTVVGNVLVDLVCSITY